MARAWGISLRMPNSPVETTRNGPPSARAPNDARSSTTASQDLRSEIALLDKPTSVDETADTPPLTGTSRAWIYGQHAGFPAIARGFGGATYGSSRRGHGQLACDGASGLLR